MCQFDSCDFHAAFPGVIVMHFQVEDGMRRADGEAGEPVLNDDDDDDAISAAEAGDEDEDNVSEISGLSDISITGAGRWHPMKGMSYAGIHTSLPDPRPP